MFAWDYIRDFQNLVNIPPSTRRSVPKKWHSLATEFFKINFECAMFWGVWWGRYWSGHLKLQRWSYGCTFWEDPKACYYWSPRTACCQASCMLLPQNKFYQFYPRRRFRVYDQVFKIWGLGKFPGWLSHQRYFIYCKLFSKYFSLMLFGKAIQLHMP